jgi:hypothetical protein
MTPMATPSAHGLAPGASRYDNLAPPMRELVARSGLPGLIQGTTINRRLSRCANSNGARAKDDLKRRAGRLPSSHAGPWPIERALCGALQSGGWTAFRPITFGTYGARSPSRRPLRSLRYPQASHCEPPNSGHVQHHPLALAMRDTLDWGVPLGVVDMWRRSAGELERAEWTREK